MLRITCPNNREHTRFVATAHVTQSWEVDENGSFMEEVESCVEVTHYPDADDFFYCAECGAEVITQEI